MIFIRLRRSCMKQIMSDLGKGSYKELEGVAVDRDISSLNQSTDCEEKKTYDLYVLFELDDESADVWRVKNKPK